ncbi:MAG: 50S ribosomal protein L10 [Patescibacteria group bacterium]|jgi:large subunit ribosomal protein L10
MAKTRAQKDALFAELKDAVAGKAIVFTQYTGLTVRDMTDLRAELRKVQGRYTVTKNTLLRKAMDEAGIAGVPTEVLDVQLAVATSATDEVEPNRIVVNFQKTHEKMEILGAVVDGKFVDAAGVKALAALPSRDELYAKMVGSIAAPLSGMVNVLAGNLRGLVTVLKQYQEKKAA